MPRWFALPQHGMKAGDGGHMTYDFGNHKSGNHRDLGQILMGGCGVRLLFHFLLDHFRWNKFRVGGLFRNKRIKGFNYVANNPLPRKKCKGSVLGRSCASISTEKAVQDQSANLTTSVRNVVQSDTGHKNVGRVESTYGPIHNKGTGFGKGQWCVCCKYPSPINLSVLLPLLEIYPN